MNKKPGMDIDLNHESDISDKENVDDFVSLNIEDYIELDYQLADDLPDHLQETLPDASCIARWLASTIAYLNNNKVCHTHASLALSLPIELSVRVVGADESQTLNNTYRGKDYATNVLSFESELPDYIPSNLIGDLVICAQVVFTEAQTQYKATSDHWAHMCIHGCLHLLGFDHINDKEAVQMESIEVEILHKLGIDDPYQIRPR